MRKYIVMSMLGLALLGSAPAKAAPLAFIEPVANTMVIGFAASALVTYLVLENVDPWTPMFGKEHVFYEYPERTSQHSKVVFGR